MLSLLKLLLPRSSRFLDTKETLPALGPLVPIPSHPPAVTIRRGYDSAVISWWPGRLIACKPAHYALHHRLQAAGFLEAIDAWIEHHGRHADPRPERQGTARFGKVLHVPLDLADALAGLVVGFLSRAVATPLTQTEFNAHCPDWQVPPFPAASDARVAPVRLPRVAEPSGFIIPWVSFGQAEHEPFTVIPWTGGTRDRASEDLDSPEYEGIAPDGERLWLSGSESVLLQPEGRQGQELHRWLTEERDKLVASLV